MRELNEQTRRATACARSRGDGHRWASERMPTCLPRAHESINDDDASLRDKYRASATDAPAARDATTCDVDARRSTARHKRSPSPMAPTDRPVSTRSSHPPSRRHPSTHSRQCAPMFRSMKHLRFRTCRAPRWHRVLRDADGLCAQAHLFGQVAYAIRNPTSYHWLTALVMSARLPCPIPTTSRSPLVSC